MHFSFIIPDTFFIQLSAKIRSREIRILAVASGLYGKQSHIINKLLIYIREYSVLCSGMCGTELQHRICLVSCARLTDSETAGCILLQIIKCFFVYRVLYQILLLEIYRTYIGNAAVLDGRRNQMRHFLCRRIGAGDIGERILVFCLFGLSAVQVHLG